MRRLFIDTWGWIAIAHRDDSYHKKAAALYKTFLLNKGKPVTTDYVLAETVTLLRAKTEPEGVAAFVDAILAAVREGKIFLERIDERRWEKAWEMSKKYKDKPGISFVDFSSFIVMKEMVVHEVLSADRHFEDVGIGFRKLF